MANTEQCSRWYLATKDSFQDKYTTYKSLF